MKITKICLQASQVENKINYLAKNKIDLRTLIEKSQRFHGKQQINIKIKNKGLKVKDIMFLLKKLIRLSYVDKRIQSVNLVETYVYRTQKDLISKEEKEIIM